MDSVLDGGRSGPLFLQRPDIAALVAEAITFRQSSLKHCELHSWVVMPNHVHLLMTPLVPVPKVMHSLKRFTAAEANRILSRSGQPFWQDESYDRLVRNDDEFQKIAYYIEMNPVVAGLCLSPERFPWSSAKPI